MSSTLRSQLDELASSFATDVLQAIRSASIEDLLAESTGGGRRAAAAARVVETPMAAPRGGARRRAGRLARRSAGDIAGVIDRIVDLVRQNPKGLRAEQIRQKLGFEAKELPRPLKEAVEAGRLGKSGQKRATTYFAKGGAAPAGAAQAAAGKAKTGRKARAGKAARATRPARAAKPARATKAAKKK